MHQNLEYQAFFFAFRLHSEIGCRELNPRPKTGKRGEHPIHPTVREHSNRTQCKNSHCHFRTHTFCEGEKKGCTINCSQVVMSALTLAYPSRPQSHFQCYPQHEHLDTGWDRSSILVFTQLSIVSKYSLGTLTIQR